MSETTTGTDLILACPACLKGIEDREDKIMISSGEILHADCEGFLTETEALKARKL